MTDVILALVPLADWDGHHDGGWWVMGLGMIVFWGFVLAGIVWLARDGFGRGHHHGPSPEGRETPREILDRRFASGDLTTEEYEERRRRLEGRDG